MSATFGNGQRGSPIASWFRQSLSRYIVWNPADLLVPARLDGSREAERVVYSERRHILYLFVTAWRDMVIAFAGVVALALVSNVFLQTVIGLTTLWFHLNLLIKVIEWTITRIIITDRRLIEFGGFLRRSGDTLPLGKLTDLAYQQSLLGLLFDYGMVRVESAGQFQALSRIRYLRYPLLFQRELIDRAIK
jgi:hypothetical protein